ncbi:Uridine-cytidine kinase-like 1 [Araneus ventricosus]|uniref:uridine/cytidine kinase n=1 Tax=Araneus ventricosus TaxID=182803 RepID=A0A4Y2QWL4_ARAVE|nr:Uridine-cytidine kinase-like 1 [Araneus ventricosus]
MTLLLQDLIIKFKKKFHWKYFATAHRKRCDGWNWCGSGDELNFEDVPADDEMQSSPLSPSFSPITSPHRVKKRERTWSSSKSGVLREPVLRTRQRTIYTAGRPPWYDTQGQLVEPFVIGICGGSASGKTTVARKVIEALDVPWVTLLSMDSFYKVLDEGDHRRAKNNDYNFDHPDAFDFDLLIETLRKLKEGKSVDVPIYNFVSHSREKRMKTMYGANVIIFEGILIFAHKQLIEVNDVIQCIILKGDSDIRACQEVGGVFVISWKEVVTLRES